MTSAIPCWNSYRAKSRSRLPCFGIRSRQLEADGGRSALESMAQAIHSMGGAAKIVHFNAFGQIIHRLADDIGAVLATGSIPGTAEIQHWLAFSTALEALAAVDPTEWNDAHRQNWRCTPGTSPTPPNPMK